MSSQSHPYASVLRRTPIPAWLENISNARSLPLSIPLENVLRSSCFYPSSGLDSSPVLLANGCVHSFVYADYGTSRKDFEAEISFRGFSPYRQILHRDIERRELMPVEWTAQTPRRFDNPGFDGRQRLLDAQRHHTFWGHWSIWQRREKHGEQVGPRLFSFLFLSGEAVELYEALYARNDLVPKVMAIIQPGHVLGDNWTNFYDPNAPLWATVASQPMLPEHLLVGGFSRHVAEQSPFEGYTFVTKMTTYETMTSGTRRVERTVSIFRQESYLA